jgi:DNA (cytosine-5)-methyltransferase 1
MAGAPRHYVTAAFLDRQFGASAGASAEAPLGTATCVNKTSVAAAFLAQYYGADGDPAVTEPLHTVTTKDRHAVVTVYIAGIPHAIVDIGMRMLAPRELFRAQGFSEGYEIETGIGPDGAPVRLTRTAQVRMCGSSVVPLLAKALVQANLAPAPAKVRGAPASLPLFATLQEAA